MEDELQRSCETKAGILYEIDQMYVKGQSVLCTTTCPCDANVAQWPEDQRNGFITSKYGSSKLTECPMDPLTRYEKQKYVPVMHALETMFQCAGMCDSPKYLLFSDVSK